MPSPYFRGAKKGEPGARPTIERLRVRNRGRSPFVERALSDFGAEVSFGRAAKQFAEHYGWEIGRTTVLRVVERRAEEVQRYVEERLGEVRRAYGSSDRECQAELLVELDGCEIRTGTLEPTDSGEKSTVRNLPKRRREEKWREVRTGFVRALQKMDRTYVSAMEPYEKICNSLFSAAVDRGLSEETTVIGVADGGNGLREGLDVVFPNMRFVLDHRHLQQHVYETADEMYLAGSQREQWVHALTDECARGNAPTIVTALEGYRGTGDKRAHRLAKYINRFSDAVDYDAIKEAGYPIGSGEVESAQRYIPQARLKIPGACWSPDTINPMLALRVLRENGWWSDFWESAATAA